MSSRKIPSSSLSPSSCVPVNDAAKFHKKPLLDSSYKTTSSQQLSALSPTGARLSSPQSTSSGNASSLSAFEQSSTLSAIGPSVVPGSNITSKQSSNSPSIYSAESSVSSSTATPSSGVRVSPFHKPILVSTKTVRSIPQKFATSLNKSNSPTPQSPPSSILVQKVGSTPTPKEALNSKSLDSQVTSIQSEPSGCSQAKSYEVQDSGSVDTDMRQTIVCYAASVVLYIFDLWVTGVILVLLFKLEYEG